MSPGNAFMVNIYKIHSTDLCTEPCHALPCEGTKLTLACAASRAPVPVQKRLPAAPLRLQTGYIHPAQFKFSVRFHMFHAACMHPSGPLTSTLCPLLRASTQHLGHLSAQARFKYS